MRDRAPTQLPAETSSGIAPAALSRAGFLHAKAAVRATAQVRRAVSQTPPGVFQPRVLRVVLGTLQPAFSAAVRACSGLPAPGSIRAPARQATVRERSSC